MKAKVLKNALRTICILYIVLLLVCTMAFLGFIHQEVPSPYKAIPVEVQVILPDSVTQISTDILDSISAQLNAIHKPHQVNYEHLLNDLRQESNNIINKWNAWFSFWIALLAILAGIIPIIVQFKLHNRIERRLKDATSSLDKHKEETRRELIDAIDKKLHDNSDDIKRHKQELIKIEIVYIINSICIGWDEQLYKDSQERITILRSSLIRLNNCIYELIQICSSKTDNYEYRSNLLYILIHIYGLFNKLDFLFITINKSRRVNEFKTELKNNIIKLSRNDLFATNDELNNMLRKVKIEIFMIINDLCIE